MVEGIEVLGVGVLDGAVDLLVVEQPYWQVVTVIVEVVGTVEYQVVEFELYVDVTGHVVTVV